MTTRTTVRSMEAFQLGTARQRTSMSRQRLLDVVVFVVCLAALMADGSVSPNALVFSGTAVSWPGLVALIAAPLPTLVRHRFPIWAFTASLILILPLLHFAGIYTAIALPAVFCGFTLAQMRGRRVAIGAGVGALALTVALMIAYSPHPLVSFDSLLYLASVALPLALGVASHERRSRIAALVARADEAERTREEEAKRRVSEDRLHIARDVHDVVAHTLVAINVQAGMGARLFDSDPALARDSLRDIKSVSGKALTDLRSILGVLRAPDSTDSLMDATVHPTRGIAHLEDLREGLSAAQVTLEITVDDDALDLPAAVDATAFRIIQEALTNVMRHAAPTTARVAVGCDNHMMTITVDNEARLGPSSGDTSGAGHGVRGMRERAAAMGGTLRAGPRPGGGWEVRASLPVELP